MIGGIIGDISGSIYEFNPIQTDNFELNNVLGTCTDDTILLVATMDSIINKRDIIEVYQEYGRKYDTSYGLKFYKWIHSDNPKPYNSYGNGSAMRVSPLALTATSEAYSLAYAKVNAEITHNHKEGIKGSQAVSMAVYLAKTGKSKEEIKNSIESFFKYDLSKTYEEIRKIHKYNESCQKTVPESIICFLDSDDFEDAVKKAILLKGDADTLACITGCIAEAYYQEIPAKFIRHAIKKLPDGFEEIIKRFYVENVPYNIDFKGL